MTKTSTTKILKKESHQYFDGFFQPVIPTVATVNELLLVLFLKKEFIIFRIT